MICNLQVASLDDDIEYSAIFYTWEEHVFDQTITLDGIEFAITKHLYSALKIFRMGGGPIFWVDQICIDQENIAERSHQVTLMTRIYSQPQDVLVWLGDEKENTFMAWYFAQNLLQLNPQWQILDVSAQSEQWNGLFDILSRPWHSRAWIVQEVTSCEKVRVCCVPCEMSIEALDALLELLERRGIDSTSFITAQTQGVRRNMENLSKLLQVRYNHRKRSTGRRPRILRVFDLFRDFQASDPRDKIYSLLWLLQDPNSAPRPDYSLPVETVYQDFARFVVSMGGGIRMLTIAGKQQTNLPVLSWCPDWTCRAQLQPFALSTDEIARLDKKSIELSVEKIEDLKAHGIDITRRMFAASGDLSGSLKLARDPLQVIARGALVDKVVQLGDTSLQRVGTMRQWWSTWMTESLGINQQATTTRYSSTIDSQLDALSRLMTADDALGIFNGRSVLRAFESSIREGSTRIEDFRVTHEQFRMIKHATDLNILTDFEIPQVPLTAFCFVVPEMVRGRRLCVTEKGFIGLVPDIVDIGDVVCNISGATAPFILRKDGEVDHYVLIGDAFILDMMQGEALKIHDFAEQDIVLI